MFQGSALQRIDVLTKILLCPSCTKEEVTFGRKLMELNWEEIGANLKLWEDIIMVPYNDTHFG